MRVKLVGLDFGLWDFGLGLDNFCLNSDTFRPPLIVCTSKIVIFRFAQNGKWQSKMANMAMCFMGNFCIWESNNSADIYNIFEQQASLLWHSSEPGALRNFSERSLERAFNEHGQPEPTKMSHTLRLPLNSDCVTPETTRLAMSVHIPRALYRCPYSTQPRLQSRIEWVKAPH